MNIIKYFFKNAWANKTMFVIYICIFATLLMINTMGAVKNEQSVFEESKARIGVISLSDDILATELQAYLKEHVGAEKELTYLPDDPAKAKELIFMGTYDAIVRIPEDFVQRYERGEESIDIFYSTLGYSGRLVESRVQGFLTFVNATKENGQYRFDKAKEILSTKSKVSLLDQRIVPSKERNEVWIRTFFNIAAYILIAVYVAVIGKSMSDFNELQNKQRVAVSSKKFRSYQAHIYLGQILIGIVITSIVVICVFFSLGKGVWEQDIKKYLLNIFVFSLSIMALTFMINNMTNNDSAKNALSTTLSLGSAFISGVFIPQEVLSDKVLTVAKLFPAYYYVLINNKTMPDSSFMIRNLSIQILFGLLFFVLGIYFAKKRRVVE
ncbi:MAG: ABC transporter permease [Peptostreptococcaceae bacterium]|nr:ABC transporter permease [Peptostreptococcaceae bacterium]